MSLTQRTTTIHPPDSTEPMQMFYLSQQPEDVSKGTILLLHGFPQTSHQFRHVLVPLASQGYAVLAPDYRGAVGSSTPTSHPAQEADYTKKTMAYDMVLFLESLDLQTPVHIVGHDIGGMVAAALALWYPEVVASVCWGECPLPGTSAYERDTSEWARVVQQFHFVLHCQPEIAEVLVRGKEREYVEHFLRNLCRVPFAEAFTEEDLKEYTKTYSQPGAMRAAFGVYGAFQEDAVMVGERVKTDGRCRVPCLLLSGELSGHLGEAEEMSREVFEENVVEVKSVQGAGHYIAEERAQEFSRLVGEFVHAHPAKNSQ